MGPLSSHFLALDKHSSSIYLTGEDYVSLSKRGIWLAIFSSVKVCESILGYSIPHECIHLHIIDNIHIYYLCLHLQFFKNRQ